MHHYHIDHNRFERLGFPEVIYGHSKDVDSLQKILSEYQARDENALVTKLQASKARLLAGHYPDAFYDNLSGIFMLQKTEEPTGSHEVAILSGGTSDVPVVNEAFHTLSFLGQKSTCYHDIGVAGLHRLTSRIEELHYFDVLIVVAGFEGALPTVVGGLLPQPIIAVPTSVGYGSAQGGMTALHAMLTSCANGISVVNIDNGYGAALAALRTINAISK